MFMQEMALQNFFPSQVVSNIMVIAQVTYLCFYWFPQMAFLLALLSSSAFSVERHSSSPDSTKALRKWSTDQIGFNTLRSENRTAGTGTNFFLSFLCSSQAWNLGICIAFEIKVIIRFFEFLSDDDIRVLFQPRAADSQGTMGCFLAFHRSELRGKQGYWQPAWINCIRIFISTGTFLGAGIEENWKLLARCKHLPFIAGIEYLFLNIACV